jgi:hypothetical protein
MNAFLVLALTLGAQLGNATDRQAVPRQLAPATLAAWQKAGARLLGDLSQHEGDGERAQGADPATPLALVDPVRAAGHG